MANRPIDTIRSGSLSVTVWKNTGIKDGKETEYLSFSIEKSIKTKDGEWKKTSVFVQNDLLKLSELIRTAFNTHGIKSMSDNNQ